MNSVFNKKRKKVEELPINEYLYITRWTIDQFHPKIVPIVRHVEELIEQDIEENRDLIREVIKTFNDTLNSIRFYFCRNVGHKLYDDVSERAKKDLRRFFDLLENLEYDIDEKEAMEAIIEIDRIFDRLFYDGVDNLTKKLVKLKIKKPTTPSESIVDQMKDMKIK